MVAAVAVQNVNGVNGVKLMLFGPGAVGLGHAGVKAAAQQGGQAGVLKPFAVGPLPAVIKIGGKSLLFAPLFIHRAPGGDGGILRLIVGGVHVVDAAGQAGLHDGQVLIGQGNVHDQIGLIALDQGSQLLHLVGVHPGGGDFGGGLTRQFGGQRVALCFGAAGNAQLGEHPAHLTAFADGHVGDAAAADDQYFAHNQFLLMNDGYTKPEAVPAPPCRRWRWMRRTGPAWGPAR